MTLFRARNSSVPQHFDGSTWFLYSGSQESSNNEFRRGPICGQIRPPVVGPAFEILYISERLITFGRAPEFPDASTSFVMHEIETAALDLVKLVERDSRADTVREWQVSKRQQEDFVIQRKDVRSAHVSRSVGSSPLLVLELTDESADKLAGFSERNIGRHISLSAFGQKVHGIFMSEPIYSSTFGIPTNDLENVDELLRELRLDKRKER